MDRLRLGLVVLLIIGTVLAARLTPLGGWLTDAARAVAGAADRPWAPFAYVAVYALALGLGAPGTLLTIAGGLAFGFARGVAVNLAGATLGAALAFGIARAVGRAAFARLAHGRIEGLRRRLGSLARPRRAFFVFLRLRLMPLVPFNGLNFAAGLTDTRFWPYLLGSVAGILPSTALYTYFSASLAEGGASRGEAAGRVAIALAGLGVLSISPTLIGRLRRKLRG